MILSKDEFLLLVQKWKNSSARVRFIMVHSGPDPSLMSTGLMIALSGTITGIDSTGSLLVLSTGDDGLVSIGFDNALLVFGTQSDVPTSFAAMIAMNEEVDEIISISQPSNLVVSIFTLKQLTA
jgi:hypothetical protein